MKKIILIIFLLICITGCKKEKVDNSYLEKINELLIKDYSYSQMAYYSSDALSDKNLSPYTIKNDDEVYIDAVKSKYKSLDELYTLVKDVFIEESYDHYSRMINLNNSYINVGENLFVKENKDYCDIGMNYDFNSFEVIKKTDTTIVIKFNNKEHTIYIVDGKYKLKYNIFECLEQ